MAEIGLHKLRRILDDAITYCDFDLARKIASQGLAEAEEKELLGEMMYFKAQFFIIDENFAEAIPFLDKAIEYNKNDGAAYNDRALAMIELGQEKEALLFFDKGIEVEGDYATIHHNKGWLLSKWGYFPQAIACFNKALELEPERAVTYENLAEIYKKQGKISEAIKAYQNALKFMRPVYTVIRQQIEEEIRELEKSRKEQS